MLTIQQIKEDPRRIVERLAVKGYDGTVTIQQVIDLDSRRRQAQLTNDNKAAELNRLAASIGKLMKEGNKDCPLYTSDAADDPPRVDLWGGRVL